jgi:hypothetical protein
LDTWFAMGGFGLARSSWIFAKFFILPFPCNFLQFVSFQRDDFLKIFFHF